MGALWQPHLERARNGVRWWRVLGLGVWVRDLRVHPRRAYDPHSLRLPHHRVSVFLPVLHARRNRRRRV